MAKTRRVLLCAAGLMQSCYFFDTFEPAFSASLSDFALAIVLQVWQARVLCRSRSVLSQLGQKRQPKPRTPAPRPLYSGEGSMGYGFYRRTDILLGKQCCASSTCAYYPVMQDPDPMYNCAAHS